MRTVYKTVVVAVVVTGVAMTTAGCPNGDGGEGNGASNLEERNEEFRSALLSVDEQPAGTEIQVEISVPEALELGMLGGAAPGVIVEPLACLDYLSPLLERDEPTPGWIQLGARERGFFSAMAASVPGGVDLNDIRGALAGCEEATITLEALDVTGRFSITEYETAEVEGAQTLGLVVRTEFPDGGALERIAPQLSCATLSNLIENASCGAGDGGVTVQDVSQALDNFSETHYFSYVASGDLVAETCELQPNLADEMALTLFRRASERGA
jgi:hypothetical protein